MHTTRGDRVGFLRPGALLSWVLVALLLTACGPFEDDEEPTATAETVAQPTSGGTEEAGAETPGATETAEATDEPSAEPTGAVTEEAAGAATPAMTEDQDEDSTPGIATPAFNLNDRSEDDATPAGEAAPDLSTPVE
ncbi:MAG TPA: hypothetical protein VD767_06030, partial [Thermomicrobiales bacterium]|nr:hypothetical protein [Thermomicrobiales bacterium]